jgi:hypothetical protein
MKAGIIATAVIVVLLGVLWFFTSGREHFSQAVEAVQSGSTQATQPQQPVNPYSNFNAPSK